MLSPFPSKEGRGGLARAVITATWTKRNVFIPKSRQYRRLRYAKLCCDRSRAEAASVELDDAIGKAPRHSRSCILPGRRQLSRCPLEIKGVGPRLTEDNQCS